MRRCILRARALFWSKYRCRILCAVLCVQLIYFYFILDQLDDILNLAEDFPQKKQINETQEELEARLYLQALIKGNAEIAPVVETAKKMPEIYLGCRLKFNEIIVHEDGWLNRNRWYLYSAYEDKRTNSLYPKLETSIQILASTFHVVDEEEKWYCHVLNVQNHSIRIRAHFRLIWQRAWDPRLTFNNPYLITCGLPNDYSIESGAVVTLKGKKCPPKNDTLLQVRLVPSFWRNLQYEPNKSNKELKIGVCVKGLDFFNDNRRELAEWILLQFEFGADSLTLYIYFVPQKTRHLLDQLAKDFNLKLIDLTIPGNVTNEPNDRHSYIWGNYAQKRRNELIPYNDCFYRYSHTHDYILLVDTDELVVSLRHKKWPKMISDFTEPFRYNATSLSIRNVFKFPDENDGVGLLGRRRRAEKIQENGVSGKSFISTQTAATVFNHFALHRLHGEIARTAYLPAEWALKLHYKTDCPMDYKKECAELKASTIEDHSLDKWKTKIKRRIQKYLHLIEN